MRPVITKTVVLVLCLRHTTIDCVGERRKREGGRVLLVALVLLALVVCLVGLGVRLARPNRTSVPVAAGAEPSQTSPVSRSAGNASAHAPAGKALAAYRLSAQHVLAYGGGEGQVGMVRGAGQPPVGPEAFALGKDGTVLIADVVNRRVLVYSAEDSYLRSVDVAGVALGDVTTDSQGRLYVYDQARRALLQYDADGKALGTLDLKPKDIDTRGYFHVVGSDVYFADAAARDVLVATLRDGVLVAPDDSAERRTEGIHGASGRVYSISVDKEQALRVEVRDPAGAGVRNVQVQLLGVVSARYAGEDEAGRFYVQTERLDGKRIVLEVLTFSASGEQLAATPMPENDYAIWTAKLVDVRADGTLVQFLPQPEQAKLNVFRR
jgi:hypothetical protein